MALTQKTKRAIVWGLIVFSTLLICVFNSLIQPAPARYYFLAAAAAIWLGVVIVIAWKDHAARKGPFWAFIILLTGVAWLAPTRPRPLG
jgi:hypothetical protein